MPEPQSLSNDSQGPATWRKYLFPHIARQDWRPLLQLSLAGALIAGGYGIAHDQLTFSLSPEYFTKLKFDQFRYADWGLGDRFFAGTIGFLATWWVGFFTAWFPARKLLPMVPRKQVTRRVLGCFLLVIACGLTGGLLGAAYGYVRPPGQMVADWGPVLRSLQIDDGANFVRVAYIHNGGYFGALAGFLGNWLRVRSQIRTDRAGSTMAM